VGSAGRVLVLGSSILLGILILSMLGPQPAFATSPPLVASPVATPAPSATPNCQRLQGVGRLSLRLGSRGATAAGAAEGARGGRGVAPSHSSRRMDLRGLLAGSALLLVHNVKPRLCIAAIEIRTLLTMGTWGTT
jgi:hypothetical protein